MRQNCVVGGERSHLKKTSFLSLFLMQVSDNIKLKKNYKELVHDADRFSSRL